VGLESAGFWLDQTHLSASSRFVALVFPLPFALMVVSKRPKGRPSTLTKIDIKKLKLRPKLQAVSQYADADGTRVTTKIKPSCPPPPPLDPFLDPAAFGVDLPDFDDGLPVDDEDDEETSKGCYIARVFTSPFPLCIDTHRL
jgi:hypothetical protein